jgi:hypothetical protein
MHFPFLPRFERMDLKILGNLHNGQTAAIGAFEMITVELENG